MGVARTLQGLGLFAGLTVLENVVAGAKHTSRAGFTSGLFALPRSDKEENRLREEAVGLLDRFGIRVVVTVALLMISVGSGLTVFMTAAWYWHLKGGMSKPILLVILISWSIALVEYCFAVPANRIGYASGWTGAGLSTTWPVGARDPCSIALRQRSSTGSMPSSAASLSICDS